MSSTFQKHHVTNSSRSTVPIFTDLAWCRPEDCISRRFIVISLLPGGGGYDCYSCADVALYRSNMLKWLAEHGDKS